MSLLERARKNIALKFASEAVTRLLALLFVVIVARRLGDREYGKYSLIFYFAGLVTIFSDLGLNIMLVREISRRRDLLPDYAGNILSLKMVLSLGVLGLSLVILPLLGYPREMVLLMLVGVISLLGNHLVEYFSALTNSLEKFEYELLIKSLTKILVVLFGLLALWAGMGLPGLIFILMLVYWGSCFLNGVIIWKKVTPFSLRWNFQCWKSLIRSTWPIGLSVLFVTAYIRLDIILLSLLRPGMAEIGWYSVPVKIIEAFSIFPYLIMSGLFPIFSLLGDQDPALLREAYQRSLGYLVMIAIPLVLIVFHLADPWLVVVFGPLYLNSIPSLEIIIWVVPFIFIHYALIHLLISLNRERLIILGSALALLFNLGSNLLLLPRYGYLGASVITVVTEVLLVAFYLFHLQRSFLRIPLFKKILSLAASGGVMALTFWALKSLPVALVFLFALTLYGTALFLFRLVSLEDWQLVKRLFRYPVGYSP
jgi:O-antigen/teichoic acid export membrane protein